MVLYLYVVDAKTMTYPQYRYQTLYNHLTELANSLHCGSYQLILTLNQSKDIIIGHLGKLTFPQGFYIYTGRHKNCITKRVYRHLNPLKKIHWHIDYLTTDADFKLGYILIYPGRLFECQIHRELKYFCLGQENYKGFGNSDCTEGCFSHLIYLNTITNDFFGRWVAECSARNISTLLFDNSGKM